jgi:hypothetical protein
MIRAYKDGVNQKRGVDAKRTMRSVSRVVGQEHTVSTRFPTAKDKRVRSIYKSYYLLMVIL